MRTSIVLLLVMLLCGSLLAQDIPAAISPELEAQLAALETVTAEIRELEPLEVVPRHFPTRAELLNYLNGVIAEELDDTVIADALAFYVAFDFLPADADLRAILLELYGQQIAGFYDTETKEMNVILISGDVPEDDLPLLDQITYVHEFVHALQDQHFGLDDYIASIEDTNNDDKSLAMLALVEGDATYAMTIFTQQATEDNPFGAMLEILSSGLEAGNLSLPADTPEIIGSELLFPYEAGMTFVTELVAAGGWQRVNDAFATPPASTEQVLHPEKYLAGEMPLEVSLVDSSTLLGGDWAVAKEGVMGEFYLGKFLDQQVSSRRATAAAAGWGGDAYTVYQHKTSGEFALTLKIAWDSAEEAAEFAVAFDDFRTPGTGSDAPAEVCMTIGAKIWCAAYGETETIITAAPTLDLAQALLDGQVNR